MATHKLEPTRLELEKLLEGTWEYTDPPSVLNGLSAEDACRPLEGCPHSIAVLVNHLHFWQQRRLKLARGEESPRDMSIELGTTDFMPVEPEEWDDLRDAFLKSYEEVLSCAADPELIKRQPFDDANTGFMLVSHTLHNAYHLGQIVLMRKLQGNWVPVHPQG